MNISEIWIRRPVMTTMVMLGVMFLGFLSYDKLPISNLPNVDFPTISVKAYLPGANPEIMAATVATPLEKQFSAIAGIDSMTSTSTLGQSTINIQFNLARDIDAAALDVNAAIAAAMGVLPESMPNPPTYKKVNPADMPIVFIAMTADELPVSDLQAFSEDVLIPNLSTINGIADIDVVPTQRYAVRIQVNPLALASRGIGINEVADAVSAGNVNLPGGTLDGTKTAYTLESNGQLMKAEDYNGLIISYQNGYPVRIQDIGRAVASVENNRSTSWCFREGRKEKGVVVRVRKQVGANTVLLADQIRAKLPKIAASMPGAMSMDILYDQSLFIKDSIRDVQYTMILTICLVLVVMFLFIRALRPTVIPSVVIPLSLVATFPIMAVNGYTLNNLSLMAMTLAIGFVVDDAIVVVENIIRRMEKGETAQEASLRGSREIGFTILSMTVSLVAVFIPIMFMGGIIGRLFREFAVVITAAILFSGFFSLTLTPMLSNRFLKGLTAKNRGRLYRFSERILEGATALYGKSLGFCLNRRFWMLVLTVAVVVSMVYLFDRIPKGFIPNQDQNFFRVFSQADDRTSYEEMFRIQDALDEIIMDDPAVAASKMGAIAGFSGDNNGIAFISLKERAEREVTVDEIITRLRPKLNRIPGVFVSLTNPPLITIGSRLATTQWQFTLQSTDLDDLYEYGRIMEDKLRAMPALADVKSDLMFRRPTVEIKIDRDMASSYGLTLEQIQDAFYSGYASRQISTIYTSSNFYYVYLELLPQYRVQPECLKQLYIRSSSGRLVPLEQVAEFTESVSPLSVNHSGQIPCANIFFNLKPGASIGGVIQEVTAFAQQRLPTTMSTGFQGSAQAFQSSFASMGFLLLVTVLVIYMILGILYESFIHPITILTALPLAGFGALAALTLFHKELDLYAYLGLILLVGIVKKNGIMMVDFALEAERRQRLTPVDSIHQACLIRFRPIMMTTLAALIGALPIALGLGAGGEARQSLGISVVGGLIFSQLMTLYITPVFYVYLDELSQWVNRRKKTDLAERTR